MSPRQLGSVLVVVNVGSMTGDARRMFPPGVVVAKYGDRDPLIGRVFHLVLRDHWPQQVTPEEQASGDYHGALLFEHEIKIRSAPHARTVIGDLASLVAILDSISKVSPWLLDGLKSR